MIFQKNKYIALNCPWRRYSGKPLIVSSLEKAIELSLKNKEKLSSNEVAKIFKPKLCFDKETNEYYWKDGQEKLNNSGDYYLIINGKRWYNGSDYPVPKEAEWVDGGEIRHFENLESLMNCRMVSADGVNSGGEWNFDKPYATTWNIKKTKHWYARTVFKLENKKEVK